MLWKHAIEYLEFLEHGVTPKYNPPKRDFTETVRHVVDDDGHHEYMLMASKHWNEEYNDSVLARTLARCVSVATATAAYSCQHTGDESDTAYVQCRLCRRFRVATRPGLSREEIAMVTCGDENSACTERCATCPVNATRCSCRKTCPDCAKTYNLCECN